MTLEVSPTTVNIWPRRNIDSIRRDDPGPWQTYRVAGSSNHLRAFDALLDQLADGSGLTTDVFGRVLSRVAMAAPETVTQAQISRGQMMAVPTVIPTSTVNRAVGALLRERLLRKSGLPPTGPGRPAAPVALGSDAWGVVGVHASHIEGHIKELTAVLWSLDLSEGASPLEPPITVHLGRAAMDAAAADVATLVHELQAKAKERGLKILGVGLEIGGHVHRDGVIAFMQDGGRHLWLGADLAQQPKLTDLAIVVENDVNARAIRQIYKHQFKERDFAVVAVFDDGVGGALVIDGRLYRGAGGAAGEIGHVTAEFPTSRDKEAVGFNGPCRCGSFGHVETLVTPDRIRQELGIDDIGAAAEEPLIDANERLTTAASVFRRAGTGLGRGLAALANIANPGRIHVVLPPAFADALPGSAGSAYLAAAEAALNDAFSTAPRDARAGRARLTVSSLPIENIAEDGANAAAACVLDAFIEHARGRDACDVLSRAAGRPLQAVSSN
jgi:predicted NBD/HSP70 family sugar kinase